MQHEHLQYMNDMDSSMLRSLMESYGQDVWNYAFFLVRSHDVADDISQDTFIRAYQSIKSFRGESSVKTWLFTITRNLAVNYRRSAFIRRVILWERNPSTEYSPSAESLALRNMLRDEVWGLVMSLPVSFREPLLLEAHYGLSMKEIAALLQVSEGTVKSRIHRARSKINKLLKEGDLHE